MHVSTAHKAALLSPEPELATAILEDADTRQRYTPLRLSFVSAMHGIAGTFVDGERLAKRERIQVQKDCTELTFGTCPAQFQVKCKHPHHHLSTGHSC